MEEVMTVEWLYWLCSYLLGTFLTAFFVAKSRGIDLSKEGTGNFGARNIGRVIGPWAFVVVMLGDALKGAVVAVTGHLLEFSLLTVIVGLIFVVLGHVYPFWRGFKGGKGVATGVGGLLFVVPMGVVWLAIGFILVVVVTRSSTKGMLGAFLAYAVYFCIEWSSASIAVFVVLLLIVWANRQNIAEKVK